jgi:iron only hydrogenase large subunit-like protein
VAAIIAPSFPAEFFDIPDHRKLIGMIREIGFKYVAEVSFGADLVADRYKELVGESRESFISSDCPSIVNYVKYYHPVLVDKLAPIVSPMVAMARVIHAKYGKGTKIVFIGPCVAKKAESSDVDEAITFRELRELMEQLGITHERIQPSEFDPPVGARGSIFPVTRGLLQTANINDDAITGNIIAAEGRIGFQEALKEFEAGLIKNRTWSCYVVKDVLWDLDFQRTENSITDGLLSALMQTRKWKSLIWINGRLTLMSIQSLIFRFITALTIIV